MVNLSLKKFDLNKLNNKGKPKAGKICVFIAQRGSGKSYAIRDILYHQRDIPVCKVISTTEQPSPFFSKFVPPAFIEYEYTPESIRNFVDRQTWISTKKANSPNSTIDPRAILVMDDLMFSANVWMKDPNFLKIFMNGRHLEITYILSLQYSIGLKRSCRSQIDFLFLFREAKMVNRRTLYENYASIIPTFEMFCELLDKCTENYGCMVIDNQTKSNDWRDAVFHYTAKPRDNFKMCPEAAWKLKKPADPSSSVVAGGGGNTSPTKKYVVRLV